MRVVTFYLGCGGETPSQQFILAYLDIHINGNGPRLYKFVLGNRSFMRTGKNPSKSQTVGAIF